MKKRIISIVSILFLMCVLGMNVSALEEPDLTRTGSISIAMTYQGNPVAGGSLTLYRVADVQEQNGADYSFVLTEAYADSGISLEELENTGTAQALAVYTAEHQIEGTEQVISKDGLVAFEDLELGLYLLVQEDAASGYEPVSPFLVSVPGMKNGSYIYDVDGSPKLALKQAPTEPPPPTEPKPPKLPQTGLTQWPIPVLAVCGLFLIVVGLVFCTAGRKNSHEN